VGFPDVSVRDEGPHWTVFRYVEPVETAEGLVAIAGGGQLAMNINKCSGRITHVYHQR
jgi:hypothetical protein